MIVATRHAGNREVRFNQQAWQSFSSTAPGRASMMAASGEYVTPDTAASLPAVGRAQRLVASQVAMLRILVYEGRRGERREITDSPTAVLLDQPCVDMSDYDWRYDIAAQLEHVENALLLKVKARGRVQQLVPVPSGAWTGELDKGRKSFRVLTDQGPTKLTPDDVLHIRGHSFDGAPFGVSRFLQHRDPLGAQLAAVRFEGSHMRNHGRPDLVMNFPQGITREQATEWKEYWAQEYGGASNAGKPVALGAGASLTPIPVSMQDAQFVEIRNMGVEDVGRITDVDPLLLGLVGDQAERRAALEFFLRVQLSPRLRRIERAFKADQDLFPFGAAAYPEFDVPDLMYADPLTRAQVQHQQIQNGSLLVDEARADNGRGPLPDGLGMIPQVTPVGGAPNNVPPPPAEHDTDEDDI